MRMYTKQKNPSHTRNPSVLGHFLRTRKESVKCVNGHEFLEFHPSSVPWVPSSVSLNHLSWKTKTPDYTCRVSKIPKMTRNDAKWNRYFFPASTISRRVGYLFMKITGSFCSSPSRRVASRKSFQMISNEKDVKKKGCIAQLQYIPLIYHLYICIYTTYSPCQWVIICYRSHLFSANQETPWIHGPTSKKASSPKHHSSVEPGK